MRSPTAAFISISPWWLLSLSLSLARSMVCSLARFKYGDLFDWLMVRVGRVCSFARRAWELAQRRRRRISFECKMNATSAQNESKRIQSNSNRLECHRITLNYQLCSIKLTPATSHQPLATSPRVSHQPLVPSRSYTIKAKSKVNLSNQQNAMRYCNLAVSYLLSGPINYRVLVAVAI